MENAFFSVGMPDYSFLHESSPGTPYAPFAIRKGQTTAFGQDSKGDIVDATTTDDYVVFRKTLLEDDVIQKVPLINKETFCTSICSTQDNTYALVLGVDDCGRGVSLVYEFGNDWSISRPAHMRFGTYPVFFGVHNDRVLYATPESIVDLEVHLSKKNYGKTAIESNTCYYSLGTDALARQDEISSVACTKNDVYYSVKSEVFSVKKGGPLVNVQNPDEQVLRSLFPMLGGVMAEVQKTTPNASSDTILAALVNSSNLADIACLFEQTTIEKYCVGEDVLYMSYINDGSRKVCRLDFTEKEEIYKTAICDIHGPCLTMNYFSK